MNLIELIIHISSEAQETLRWIFGRDFGALAKEIPWIKISIADLVALYVALYTTKEIVIFFFQITGKVVASIFRNAFNYVGISSLLLLRSVWLRIRGTALYLYHHDHTQEKIEQFIRFGNTQLTQIIQRIK